MTNPDPLVDCASPEYQDLTLGAVCIGLRHEHASCVCGIDLKAEGYAAINALSEGRLLSEVLDMVSAAHPFGYKLRAELIKVAGKLADRPIQA